MRADRLLEGREAPDPIQADLLAIGHHEILRTIASDDVSNRTNRLPESSGHLVA